MHREKREYSMHGKRIIPPNDRSVAILKCNMEYYRDPSVTEGSVSLVEFGYTEKTPNEQRIFVFHPQMLISRLEAD